MFWWKKMTPKLVVLQVVKKLQVLEKKIFSKQKNPSRLFVQITPTNLQNGVRKLFFTIKLLMKLDQQKIKKIPHIFLKIIISQIIL